MTWKWDKNMFSKYLFLVEDNILLDTWTSLSTIILVHKAFTSVQATCNGLPLISNPALPLKCIISNSEPKR